MKFLCVVLMVSMPILVGGHCNASEEIKVDASVITVGRMVDANPVGTPFSELEKFLHQVGIKYFRESREDLERKKLPDIDDSIIYIIAFAVEGEDKEFDGQLMQGLDLVYVKFDSSSRIVGYSFKKTYRE